MDTSHVGMSGSGASPEHHHHRYNMSTISTSVVSPHPPGVSSLARAGGWALHRTPHMMMLDTSVPSTLGQSMPSAFVQEGTPPDAAAVAARQPHTSTSFPATPPRAAAPRQPEGTPRAVAALRRVISGAPTPLTRFVRPPVAPPEDGDTAVSMLVTSHSLPPVKPSARGGELPKKNEKDSHNDHLVQQDPERSLGSILRHHRRLYTMELRKLEARVAALEAASPSTTPAAAAAGQEGVQQQRGSTALRPPDELRPRATTAEAAVARLQALDV